MSYEAHHSAIHLLRVPADSNNGILEKLRQAKKQRQKREEELKKFHPSLEIEDAEEAIYNQDLTDMADVLIKLVKESKDDEEE